MISTLLMCVSAAVYLAATMRYQRSLYTQSDSAHDTWVRGRGLMHCGFVVQIAGFVAAGFEESGFPALTLSQSLALMCWMMVGLYLLLGARWNMEVLGAFAAPTATVMMMTALATLHFRAESPSSDLLLSLHVTCIVLGYASFLLATIVAILYFFQTFLLKHKSVTGVFLKMPPLENLDRVTYHLIGLGFLPMVIGIVLGFVRAESHGGPYWSADVLLGILTVIIYALYMNARLVGGWHGRKVNALLLVGFVFLVATYLGIGLLPWSVHRR